MNEREPLSVDDLALVTDDHTTTPVAPVSPAGAQQPADDGDDDAGSDTDEALANFADDAEDQDRGGDSVGQIERQSAEDRELDRPERREDYEIKLPDLPDGRQWTAQDQQVVTWFQGTSHKLGLSNYEAVTIKDEFLKFGADFERKRVSADAADRKSLNNAVKRIWGDAAAENRGVVNSFLGNLSQDFAHELKTARANPGGPLLLNSPAMVEILRLAALGRRREGANARIGEGYTDDRRLTQLKRALETDANSYFDKGLDRVRATIEERSARRQPAAAPRPGDAARLAYIRKVLNQDFSRYEREGLSQEFEQLLARAGEE